MLCHILLMTYCTVPSGKDLCFHSAALPEVLHPPPTVTGSDTAMLHCSKLLGSQT